jgi:hypothetical protein
MRNERSEKEKEDLEKMVIETPDVTTFPQPIVDVVGRILEKPKLNHISKSRPPTKVPDKSTLEDTHPQDLDPDFKKLETTPETTLEAPVEVSHDQPVEEVKEERKVPKKRDSLFNPFADFKPGDGNFQLKSTGRDLKK